MKAVDAENLRVKNIDADAETAPPSPVLVQNLGKDYKTVRAVDGISFQLARGTITALLGGNGAGKTTTISMILGLVTPSFGSAHVFGVDMARHRSKVLHRMNFESPYVDMPMRLTGRQNLTVYARLYGVARPGARVAQLADELQLKEFIDRPVGRLSAGQKTRISLAKALLNTPELLLLDEPTASLDPDTADWIRGKLEQFQKDNNSTIILASHNMAEVERLASRVIMLEAGRIIEDGSPQALIKHYKRDNLEQVFLDIVRRPIKQEQQ